MEEINIRRIFGENVKKYRKKMGLSQEQLSERLEISPNHLSVIETGTKFVTYKLLEKIIKVFQVPPMALFFSADAQNFDESNFIKLNSIVQNELSLCAEKIINNAQEIFFPSNSAK